MIYTFFRTRWGKDLNGKFYCCLHGFTLLHYSVNLRQSLITSNLETLVHLLIFYEIHTIGFCIQLIWFFFFAWMLQFYSKCYFFTFSVFRTSHHIISFSVTYVLKSFSKFMPIFFGCCVRYVAHKLSFSQFYGVIQLPHWRKFINAVTSWW